MYRARSINKKPEGEAWAKDQLNDTAGTPWEPTDGMKHDEPARISRAATDSDAKKDTPLKQHMR